MGGGSKVKVDMKPLAEAFTRGAELEAEAARENIAEFKRQHEQARQDLMPWREIGLMGLDELETGVRTGQFEMPEFKAPTMEEVEQSPGYQFRRQEGERALRRQLAAGGMMSSGAGAQAAVKYGQNFAEEGYNTEYDRAVKTYAIDQQRRGNRFNRLMGLAGMGQTATGSIVDTGKFYTSGAAGQRTNAAVANSQAGIGGANAMIAQQMYSNQQQNNKFNTILGMAGLGVSAAGAYAKSSGGGWGSAVLGAVGGIVGGVAGGPAGAAAGSSAGGTAGGAVTDFE